MGEVADKMHAFCKEIDEAMDSLRETIKKYNIVEPEKNVGIFWKDGKLCILFTENYWPVSDK